MPYGQKTVVTLVEQEKDKSGYRIRVREFNWRMKEELVSTSMAAGSQEPLYPQTQKFDLDKTSNFYLTYEAYNEYFVEGEIRNKLYW